MAHTIYQTTYQAPDIEIIEVAIEKGFSTSEYQDGGTWGSGNN